MNKKMRTILAAIETKRVAAKSYTEGETKDLDKAKAMLDEIDELTKEFEIEKRIFEAEKAINQPDEAEIKDKADAEKPNGFALIAKMLKGKRNELSDSEKALIVGGVSGEDYLLPEDVKLAIRELRKKYVSAKDLLTVTTTDALKGSINYESGTVAGLTSLTDGNDIDATGQPTFAIKTWVIDFFAKIIPVSNILSGAEKAGLMNYLNKWFVKNAIYTENNAIFAALTAGKSVKALVGWKAFKTSINVDLDPAALLDAVIVTNQTGFSTLDNEVDADGRPVLQPNPANPTQKLFQGLPIIVFSDAQLPNVTGLGPVFYGSLKAGAEFIDYDQLQFAASEHFYFGKNQTALRVIEGFDVIQTDTASYIYGTFAATV